ncbi:MAG: LolA family protein [Bryobacteraceae bacterium]
MSKSQVVRFLPSVSALLCASAALSGLSPGASAAGTTLDQTFTTIDKAAIAFRGFKADIRKVSHLDAINEDTVDSGTVTVRRTKPKELDVLVDFKEPDPKKVLLSSKKVEIYYPHINSVDVYDFTKEYKLMAQEFLLLGFGSNSAELKSAYMVTMGGPETVGDQKATRIVLTPKDKELAKHYPKFELWISDQTGIAVQQKFYGTGGDYEVATYTHMTLMNVPESDVKLQVPKDAVWNRPVRDK